MENKALKDYRAPTLGVEKELFTAGAVTDAADFEEVRKKLARYAGVNFKQGVNMAQKAIEEMTSPSLVEPTDPDASASQVEIKKWKVRYKELQNEKKAWKDAGPQAYQLILVHCHPNLEQKLVAFDKYARVNQVQDPVELLKLVMSIAHKHEDEKGGTMARVEHDLRLYMCFQKPSMSNVDYYKRFKAIRAIVDVQGGRAGFHEGIYKEQLREIRKESGLGTGDAATDEMREKAMVSACAEYLGCLFIKNADDERYQDFTCTLDNANLLGKEDYPTSIEDGLRIMENHNPSQGWKGN